MKLILFLVQNLRANFGKIVILMAISFVLFIFFFPTSDLHDKITSEVALRSQGSVYLEMEGFSLLPNKMSLQGLEIEPRSFSPLKIQQLDFSFSPVKLIQMAKNRMPYGEISVENLLGGDLILDINPGPESTNGVSQLKLKADLKRLSLQRASRFAKTNFPMKGSLNLEIEGSLDPTFSEQPDGKMELVLEKFELPPGSFDSPMGPVPTPSLYLSKIQIKGRINDGRLYIDNGNIGGPNDEMSGTIKGSLQLSLVGGLGTVTPRFGSYDFEVDLQTTQAFDEKVQFLILLNAYKKPTEKGSLYKFKMMGQNFMGPPTLRAN
jgi:hypothetical protein